MMSCAQVAAGDMVTMRNSCPTNPTGSAPNPNSMNNRRNNNNNKGSQQGNNNNNNMNYNAKFSPNDDSDRGGVDIHCPGPHDVLLGRGGGTNNHEGNRNFRRLVCEHKMRYLSCSKIEKPAVAREVVMLWQRLEPPGRFLIRKEDGKENASGKRQEDEDKIVWVEVSDKKAREKASQCLRERTPDVVPYIRQLREQQDQMTEQGVSMIQQQLQMHREAEEQQKLQDKNGGGGGADPVFSEELEERLHHNVGSFSTYARRNSLAESNPYQSNMSPTMVGSTGVNAQQEMMMMNRRGSMPAMQTPMSVQSMQQQRRISAPHLSSRNDSSAGMAGPGMNPHHNMMGQQQQQAFGNGMAGMGMNGMAAAGMNGMAAAGMNGMAAAGMNGMGMNGMGMNQMGMAAAANGMGMGMNGLNGMNMNGMGMNGMGMGMGGMEPGYAGNSMYDPFDSSSMTAMQLQQHHQHQMHMQQLQMQQQQLQQQMQMQQQQMQHAAQMGMRVPHHQQQQQQLLQQQQQQQQWNHHAAVDAPEDLSHTESPNDSGRIKSERRQSDGAVPDAPGSASVSAPIKKKKSKPGVTEDPPEEGPLVKQQTKPENAEPRRRNKKAAAQVSPSSPIKVADTSKPLRQQPQQNFTANAITCTGTGTSKKLKGALKQDPPEAAETADDAPLPFHAGTEDEDAQGELTLEEYRKTLESYMASNNISNTVGTPYEEDVLSVESFEEWPDEEPRSKTDKKKKLSRGPPSTRNVDRNKSGTSMMSTQTIKSNATSLSGLSMLSNMSMDDKLGDSSARHGTSSRRFSSNDSVMSQLTDISHNLDGLGLEDDGASDYI